MRKHRAAHSRPESSLDCREPKSRFVPDKQLGSKIQIRKWYRTAHSDRQYDNILMKSETVKPAYRAQQKNRREEMFSSVKKHGSNPQASTRKRKTLNKLRSATKNFMHTDMWVHWRLRWTSMAPNNHQHNCQTKCATLSNWLCIKNKGLIFFVDMMSPLS